MVLHGPFSLLLVQFGTVNQHGINESFFHSTNLFLFLCRLTQSVVIRFVTKKNPLV